MDQPKTCLVIDSRKLESMKMDGPALRVRLHAQSSRLFPLRRLSRIHIVGSPVNGLEALVHCAERQVPVAFFSVHGKLRCQLYFPVCESDILGHWLDHVDFDPQAKAIYEDWLHHQALHVISLIGGQGGSHQTRKQLIEERLRAICNKQLGEQKFRDAVDWLDGMLTAHLSQVIVQHGLSDQGRSKRRLMEDITPLGRLWLLYFLAEKSGTCKNFSVNAHSISSLYQQSSERIEYTVRSMLARLASRLESII